MRNLTSPFWIKFKGLLFLVLGILSAGLLFAMHPEWPVALLSGLMVWAFCRAYYCAFYVIEHYVDGAYRFAGLSSFLVYLITGKAEIQPSSPPTTSTRSEFPS